MIARIEVALGSRLAKTKDPLCIRKARFRPFCPAVFHHPDIAIFSAAIRLYYLNGRRRITTKSPHVLSLNDVEVEFEPATLKAIAKKAFSPRHWHAWPQPIIEALSSQGMKPPGFPGPFTSHKAAARRGPPPVSETPMPQPGWASAHLRSSQSSHP